MGYIINAIKAFVSKEPNEFNEGNLSVAEKKELDEIRKEDKTEAILKSLKTNKQKVVELPKRKVYREKFEEKKDIQEKEDSKRDER
jgi:hypothetical protein